jgi:YD repeat-containing protein
LRRKTSHSRDPAVEWLDVREPRRPRPRARAFAAGSTAGEPNRPPLVELGYAFDQASNLVAKADARHGASRKRDEQYTLDGLMRLLKARRGDFTGADPVPSAFAAEPGTQRYQYDFVGNIRSTDILANASEQQSPADRKLAASFNAVNEQANYVETVGGGSTGSVPATFAITHDAAGNVRTRETVAGGNRLAYRHDRWGRLTEVKFEVKTTSGYDPKPRARYRYNAQSLEGSECARSSSATRTRPTAPTRSTSGATSTTTPRGRSHHLELMRSMSTRDSPPPPTPSPSTASSPRSTSRSSLRTRASLGGCGAAHVIARRGGNKERKNPLRLANTDP